MKPKFIIITTIPLSLNFFRGQIQVLKKHFNIEVLSSPGEELTKVTESEQVYGNIVPMTREVAIIADSISLLKMIIILRKLKPAIVHGSTPKAGFLSMLASRIVGVKHRIYYLHGLRYDGLTGRKKKFLQWMERMTCKLATDVFAVSFGVRENMIKDQITNKPIQVINNGSVNGINLDYFSREADISSDFKIKKEGEDTFVFGFVGRLVKDKGINELVEAFKKVHAKHPHTKLLLVGDFEDSLDPVKEETKNEIKAYEDIVFTGYQREIRPYLMQMDVFVFPSYREGFGVSLMEALAMEVPAISSNIIGCNEIIENGHNGLLIPSHSTEHLEHAMLRLLEDKKLYQQIKANTRAYVTAKYNQAELWEATRKAYLKLLGESEHNV